VLFRQVLHADLACASYVIADGGQAAVVDPKWEITDYLALAARHGFQFTHIVETHNHADHLSGRGRLAAATGATLHISAEAGAVYEHEALADGDVVEIGQARIRAVATPGHRPEHTAFVVEDGARSDDPWGVLTGDSLFVADMARPDLAVQPEDGARGLYRSAQRLLELPDFVEVWPGHIGGSLCGGTGMSRKPVSTIGYERHINRFLAFDDEDAFVDALAGDRRPQPPNFERIVELNRGPLIAAAALPEPGTPAVVRALAESGALVLDGRSPREFDSGHLPGSINVTIVGNGVGTKAAWVAEPDTEIVIVAASGSEAKRMAALLQAIGFSAVRSYLAGGVPAWLEAGLPIEKTAAVDPATAAEHLNRDKVVLLDVREDDEWRRGHVPGSLHVPYHDLKDGVPDDVRRAAGDKTLAVVCSVGTRSSIAASLLRRQGIEDLEHVVDGGVTELESFGVELVRGPRR
jgi:hydroxyacylglutathione hydrolase